MVSNVYLHFFRQNKLCFQTIPGIGSRNFKNFALFANSVVFIMVSNVYLHFFDESRLLVDVVRGGVGSYGIVRGSAVWYRILQSGTEWYGMLRSGTC